MRTEAEGVLKYGEDQAGIAVVSGSKSWKPPTRKSSRLRVATLASSALEMEWRGKPKEPWNTGGPLPAARLQRAKLFPEPLPLLPGDRFYRSMAREPRADGDPDAELHLAQADRRRSDRVRLS